jgi:hypothetical protein
VSDRNDKRSLPGVQYVGRLPEYRIWQAMKARCYNRNHKHFCRYGGRGIEICKKWLDSFVAFYVDMGNRPDGCCIDRIDNDGSYSPENCRWATHKQSANNRSNTKKITFDGKTLLVTEWAKQIGCKPGLIFTRLHRGLPLEEVFRPPYTYKTPDSTGVRGVYAKGKRFVVKIKTSPTTLVYLGTFDTVGEAHEAYEKAHKSILRSKTQN